MWSRSRTVATKMRLLVAACLLALTGAGRGARAAPAIVAPQPRHQEQAAYPPDGKGDATVVLALLIDATGAVADVQVRQGEPPFVDAAVAAVKTWVFSPATRDDVAVAARITAVVTFRAPSEVPVPIAPAVPAPEASGPGPASASPTAPAEPVVEVAVKGEHEELGSIHIPRAQTRFIPGAFGDPFRVVEALPGMSPWISGLPYYYVRGMSPENVGYFIDGIKIPLLFHVGSGPSVIAPSLVDTVDMFPAAYPARYGRYAGAVIAGETAPPNEQRAHGEFQVRVFDAAAIVEAPLRDGQETALAAARYGYTGPLLSIIDPDYSLAYWDYQARFSHRLSDRDTLSLFAFGSYDRLENFGSPTFRVTYHRADLRYDHALRDGNVRVAATLSYDDTLTALQTDTGAGSAAALKGPGARLRTEYDSHVSSTAWVRAGADVGATRFDVDEYMDALRAPHTDVVGGFYTDVVWRPARPVEITPGFRFDAYDAPDHVALAPQPRLSSKVKLAPGVAWISALGVAHQEPTDEVFVPAKLPDPIDEEPRWSYQASEAVEVQLPASMRVRMTGFATLIRATRGGDGERSAGGELFVSRDFTRRLGGFVSYTLSRTEETSGGRTFRPYGDSTHLLSVVLGYDLGNQWRVGSRLYLRSGRPYTASCETIDCSPGESAKLYAVTGELPAFYRIDARIEKRWTFADDKWLAGTLEVFNALDKGEATGTNDSPRSGLTIHVQNPIILPSIGVEGGF